MSTPFKKQNTENILEELNKKDVFGSAMDRYSVTKLLNVVWARQLASQVSAGEVIVNFFNPGSLDTGLHRDGKKTIQLFDRFIGRKPKEGGRLVMDAALAKGSNTHGKYLSEAKLAK